MTLRLADGRKAFLDFREKAPLAAKPDMYLDTSGSVPLGRMTYRSCSRRCADDGRAALRLRLDFSLRGGG